MKNIILSVVGSVIASVAACAFFFGGASFGSISSPATNFDFVQISQGLQMPAGPSVSTSLQGSQIQAMFSGTCNATFIGASLAATSTGIATCAIPGVLAGDRVFFELPAGATGIGGGLFVTGGFATTSGIAAYALYNLTGAATTSFAQATTGVQYWITR